MIEFNPDEFEWVPCDECDGTCLDDDGCICTNCRGRGMVIEPILEDE